MEMDAAWVAAYFERVKKCWLFWWIWASQKFILPQHSLRRNWTPEQLSGLLIHVTSTPPWLLRPVKISTSSELYPDCFQLATFLDCLGIQFFNSSLFPTQFVRPPLAIYSWLCNTCVTYRMPCHTNGHQTLPTQPLPREAEDFPRGDNHFKHVLLPTYVAFLQPILLWSWIFIYTCQTADIFACGENFDKKI